MLPENWERRMDSINVNVESLEKLLLYGANVDLNRIQPKFAHEYRLNSRNVINSFLLYQNSQFSALFRFNVPTLQGS